MDKAHMALYHFYVYLFCMFLSMILLFILVPVAKNKIISYRAARWVAVCATALTVIPACATVMWPFAVGATSIYCVFAYFSFVIYEKRAQEKQEK